MITTLLFDFANVLLLPTDEGYALNAELIEFVRSHQEYKSHIYSSVSPERLADMRSQLIPPFISIFSSRELNLPKDNAESYRQLAKILDITPEEIVFTDDKSWNTDAAQAAGLKGICFESNQSFLRRLTRLLKL